MIEIYQHKCIPEYIYFVIDGLLDTVDVTHLDLYFRDKIPIPTPVITFVDIRKTAKLTNLSFVWEMRSIVEIYKPYIASRNVFGLSGIQHIIFKNYIRMIGLENAYTIFSSREACEEAYQFKFPDDFSLCK